MQSKKKGRKKEIKKIKKEILQTLKTENIK